MSCGIYSITNKLNNKIYVGQSKQIEIRWKEHINSLNNNKHHNSHLQNAWNTYGTSGFSFAIIEYCSQEELTAQEDYWIKHFSSIDRTKGYNLRDAGNGSNFRPETIERMRLSQIGKQLGEKNSGAKITEKEAITIIGMLLEGKNIQQIEKELSISHKIIRRIRNKENWAYLTSDTEFPCLERSKYLGVSYDKGYKKWRANVHHNKQRVYLEYFATEIEAAKVRDIQAAKYFGDKAKLNFPN